jgi:hypothetical protein
MLECVLMLLFGCPQAIPCGLSPAEQRFSVPSGGKPGAVIAEATGLCLDGYCANVTTGCQPLRFAQCTGSSSQTWNYTGSTLVNGARHARM